MSNSTEVCEWAGRSCSSVVGRERRSRDLGGSFPKLWRRSRDVNNSFPKLELRSADLRRQLSEARSEVS